MSTENMLSQQEIDSLLSGDFGLEDENLDSIVKLQEYLLESNKEVSKYKGIFTREAHIISFFGDTNSGSILDEIKNKNKSEGIPPVTIGDVTLINYSYCPNCNLSYSWSELNQYYSKPFVPPGH